MPNRNLFEIIQTGCHIYQVIFRCYKCVETWRCTECLHLQVAGPQSRLQCEGRRSVHIETRLKQQKKNWRGGDRPHARVSFTFHSSFIVPAPISTSYCSWKENSNRNPKTENRTRKRQMYMEYHRRKEVALTKFSPFAQSKLSRNLEGLEGLLVASLPHSLEWPANIEN